MPGDEGEPPTHARPTSPLWTPSSGRNIPNVDSEEALEKWQDQPKSPDHAAANEEGNNAVLGLSFHRNHWMSLEDVAFTSVHQNDKADMVDLQDSIKSFTYELNLHGFSIIHHSCRSAGKKRMTIYHYSKFHRDKPLLQKPATGTTATPKSKKQGTSTVHGTLGQHSFVFCGLWFMGSGARGPRSSHLLSEQGCPSGEGPSSNGESVAPATAERDGAWELPQSSPRYLDYGSAMILYNTYDSIMRGAISFVAPNEVPEAEEEQEESSDYKCALCEEFKDKPNP
ncbi:hypothetical protein FD754_025246 [Muntiacus muntjak]|uniref:HSF-type DNA-binding domain-containing protein n=1 Tax=Muntiacus muntjak TaxID=9888 RepID=A0A5N3UL16_MUNMU|nr:hypothetical protein FD754_025247 [Muntiacus muntjak]KAB0337335.1 hypothetical protein FD754_025246 [Muntiacus muntjak]